MKKVLELVTSKGYSIINIDSVVQLEKPKISGYIPDICDSLSEIMKIGRDTISIKAKTSEGIDSVGREEAISVTVVVLLQKTI